MKMSLAPAKGKMPEDEREKWASLLETYAKATREGKFDHKINLFIALSSHFEG